MASDHFKDVAGYERYADQAKAIREAGLEAAATGFAECALAGTPDRILQQLGEIKDALGEYQLVVLPSFGAMPYEQAERSLELFAKEVMPAARELVG
jgi:alkanesulfonate monooxygenase SsuD/methylene tetrahydromethanopterin reductase-like flavin-dependent oxidoreductase (luciferase family)